MESKNLWELMAEPWTGDPPTTTIESQWQNKVEKRKEKNKYTSKYPYPRCRVENRKI
jgi:hypothetical protein